MRLPILVVVILTMVFVGRAMAQTVTVSCPEAIDITVTQDVGTTAVLECSEYTPTPTLVPTFTSTSTPTQTSTVTATVTVTPTATLPAGLIVPDQYSTISAAVTASVPGDAIWVRAGVYKEQVNLNKNGLRLELLGTGTAVIDGECNRTHNIYVKGHDVVVRGMTVTGALQGAIKIDGQSGVQPARSVIENNVISNFNCTDQMRQDYAGVNVYFGGSGHRILNNQITYRTGGVVQGYGTGIYFQSTVGRPSGGGHTISGNVIVGGYDGIGGGVEDDDRGSFDKDTTISFNHVSECWDDGIQVEGGNANVTVADNIIEECAIGVAFAPDRVGPMSILRNSIVSSSPGYYNTVACFKVGDGGTGTAFITANVCNVSAVGTGDGLKQTNPINSSYVMRDNRMNVSRYVFELSSAPGSGSSFDRDCLYSTSGTWFKYNNVNYSTLAAFRAATGQELNGSAGPC